jgi:two-component system sensor histidine kinase PilS (NtrC family)
MEPARTQVIEGKKTAGQDRDAYPLSATLTARVVSYLNVFRLFISVALTIAFQTGVMIAVTPPQFATLTSVGLSLFIMLSIALLVLTHRQALNSFALAKISLFTDMAFLSLLYTGFGGLESGLGVLLIFISAAAAILLPLRMALFLASIATLVIIGEAFFAAVTVRQEFENLVSAGLYGLTNFLTAILVHLLAFWARDYRLIAERQQRHLTRLEQINELIIRRMRGGVLAVDQQGEIQMMNESAWFLLGSPASTDRVLNEVSPELFGALEEWRVHPGGDTRPLTLQASQAKVLPKFVTLPGEQEIRVLVFLEDNDVVAQRALEMSTHSLAKLSGSIAHEIRNPLAAVSHAAQLLAESQDINEADQRLLAIINKQSRRMNDIVENILQLSRREKSRPDLFALKPWLVSLLDEFKSALAHSNITLTSDLQDGDPWVMFDRSQLHQALWKLMENAVDHAGDDVGSPEVTLRMTRKDSAGYCIVSVENNGAGIPPDQIEHIFEPFYTTRQQGSGLGLYVARQLCEANQAEITVDSTPGWKTRFHVRLALAEQVDTEINPEDGVVSG